MKTIHLFIFLLLSFTVFSQNENDNKKKFGKLKPHYKGYDIFAQKESVYIVRSDIGYYLRVKGNLGTEEKAKINPLHYALADANAYVGFYGGNEQWVGVAIWDEQYSVHDDWEKGDPTGRYYDIGSEEAKNGDFYFAIDPKGLSKQVYVIKENNFYIFNSLKDSESIGGGELPEYIQEMKEYIVAFWAKQEYIYFLVSNEETGPVIYRTKSLYDSEPSITKSAPSVGVKNFLIGGLTAELGGGSSVDWEEVSFAFPFCNNTYLGEIAVPEVTESITIGSLKEKSSSFEKYWEVSSTVSAGVEAGIYSAQMELTSTFGGSSTKTSLQQWSTEETSSIVLGKGINLEQGECINYWQGVMYLNGEKVLTTGIRATNGEKPTEPPVFEW